MRVIDFHPEVFLSVSDVSDGNIKYPKLADWADDEIMQNRRRFLEKSYAELQYTAWIVVDYDMDAFAKYYYINTSGKFAMTNPKSSIPVCEGLATMSDGLPIFLPLADCLGVVLFDEKKKVLMVVHSGRHNLKEDGLTKAVEFLTKYGAEPKDIKAWLSPSAGAKNYPLHKFNGKSLKQVAREQLKNAGVKDITSDEVDTTVDENYFSHSQGDREKRHAILAYIK